MRANLFLFFLICTAVTFTHSQNPTLGTNSGTISFRSDAALEVIKAESHTLMGRIEEGKRTFAFEVLIRSFEGFNSGLQQIHFNENYLETDKFPDATFYGKIIEPIDFSKNGKTTIRAKGLLKIHGIEQERIIKSEVTIFENKIHLESNFTVQLADHGIRIPRVVHEKVATEIKVNVKADLSRK
ncbi:MAG: YceI family protein [Bacteroidota bacterium]